MVARPPLVTIALAWYTRDALICAGGSVVLFVVFGVFLLDGFQLLPY